jgi:hypothetical protein
MVHLRPLVGRWRPFFLVQGALVHQAAHEAGGNSATALHVATARSDGNQTWQGMEWMVFGKSLANGMENHILP